MIFVALVSKNATYDAFVTRKLVLSDIFCYFCISSFAI